MSSNDDEDEDGKSKEILNLESGSSSPVTDPARIAVENSHRIMGIRSHASISSVSSRRSSHGDTETSPRHIDVMYSENQNSITPLASGYVPQTSPSGMNSPTHGSLTHSTHSDLSDLHGDIAKHHGEDVMFAENDSLLPSLTSDYVSRRHLIRTENTPAEPVFRDVIAHKPSEIQHSLSDPGLLPGSVPRWHETIGEIRSAGEFDAVENLILTGNIEVGDGNISARKIVPLTVPTLKTCMMELKNPEVDRRLELYNSWFGTWSHHVATTFLDIGASFIVYFIHTFNTEAILVAANASAVSYYFCYYSAEFAVKLDFSILAFAVVFPLSFLIQQAYSRREQALVHISDFRALTIQTVVSSLTWDWPHPNNSKEYTGRLNLPKNFNELVRNDAKELFCNVYAYLSMPMVSHARHLVFPQKRRQTRDIHAAQNDLIKRVNDVLFRLHCQCEIMKEAGFPAGEASRLHQYHWYLQQRFEDLRFLKYYRTPQGARSFGRVYVLVLPWFAGPYFAWVKVSAGLPFTIALAAFEFLVLLGLLNTQKYLEDPFVEIDNGFDHIRLKYEFASGIQSVEQHFALAAMRSSAVAKKNKSAI